jgi:hypothetical protein
MITSSSPKEPTMPSPTDQLPSAEDHYRRACELLADADKSGYNLAEVHARVETALARIQAGELALQIWPVYLTNLERVWDAAAAFLDAEPASLERQQAYERLATVVKAAS